MIDLPDSAVERAAVVHYDHHYGTGEFRKLMPRTQRRLIFRMRAALATLLAEAPSTTRKDWGFK